jgi:tetrahydromethanopterin S-methyltransferase subunit G
MKMCKKILIFLALSILLSPVLSFAKNTGFRVTNEMIYQKLIEIEKRQAVFEERFKQIDKRFEQIDKRFEDMNKRFEEQNQLFRWIVGILGGIVVSFVALLIWDRRTAVSAAIRESERRLEDKFRLSDLPKLIEVLREKAKRDKELAEILRTFHLL